MPPPRGTPNPSPAVASLELQAGATLSHYLLLEQIGRGGMGTVFRARDTRLQRDVAVKVINAEVAADEDRIARFRREATILAALNHPGIVAIHDTGHEHGHAYLVTELVDGTGLRSALPDVGTLGARRLIEIGAQIADALAAAHALGILHRDLKPENVMLTRQGRVKLLDFGLAKPREAASDRDETRTVLNTEAGVVMGTVGYMSPEQVRGEALDTRSDIFSLGVMLHEMLAGARPFEGATAADVMSAVLRADPPPLPDAIPAGLRSIVQRCLNRQPPERFQSASDLAFALTNVSGSTAAVGAAGAESPNRSFRRLAVGLAAAVVLAVGLLTGLVAYRERAASAGEHSVHLRPFATEAHGEGQPIWSPDGRSLAYVAAIDGRQHLFVKGLDTTSAVPLLRCPAICDTVGWSADGSRIFYQSRTTHLDARLWSIARTGGGPALVFKDDVQLLASAFSPDGRRLAILRVIANPEVRGLSYGLFLSEPPAEPVRFEPFPLENLVTPTRITWAPDSTRLLVFTGGSRLVHVVSLADRTVRKLPRVEGGLDLSWGRDPRFAVAAQSSLTVTRSGLEWLDTETGRFSPLLSSESVLSNPSVSPDGTKVAYTVGELDYDLVALPLDGAGLRPLLGSRLPEHSVHYSPRADEFAYVAAGDAPEIRVRQPATLAERIVVSRSDFTGQAGPVRFASAAFSRDGTKIAYNYNFAIWISPANGGAPAKLTPPRASGEFGAEWSPDDAWIAFNYASPGFGGLVKVRVGGAELPIRLREGQCGLVAPAWSPDGAWIACGRGAMGLDLVPADGGPPRFLGTQYEPVAAWSRDPNRLYVIRASEGRRELGELTWQDGRFRVISSIPADFEIENAISWGGRLSLSHDGKSLVTAVRRSTGDIWIMDGLRPPAETWWKRLLAPSR